MEKLIIALLFVSLIADQLMQPENVMYNKQTSFTALGMHCLFYGFIVSVYMVLIQIFFPQSNVIWLGPVMVPIHFVVEFTCLTFANRLYNDNLRRSYIFMNMLEHLVVNVALIIIFFCLLKP